MLPLLHFIRGYCSYKITKRGCEHSKIFVSGNNIDKFNDARNSFKLRTDRGGLAVPSQEVITCVIYCILVIQKILNEKEQLFLKQNCQREILKIICQANIPSEIFQGFDQCLSGLTTSSLNKSIILRNNYTKNANDKCKKKIMCQPFKRIKGG